MCFSLFMVVQRTLNTTGERLFSNARDAVRDCDARQAVAVTERATSNACDAVRDGDACQSCAVLERVISNACDAIVYYNLFD